MSIFKYLKIGLMVILILVLSISWQRNYSKKKFYSNVITAINKKDFSTLNLLIDTAKGVLFAGKDGVYPISTLESVLTKENTYLILDSVNTEYTESPIKYLGNGAFSFIGFYIEQRSISFVDKLNSVKLPLLEFDYKKAKYIEGKTISMLSAVNKYRNAWLDIYFFENNGEIRIAAISKRYVQDSEYINRSAKKIPFENTFEIDRYLDGNIFSTEFKKSEFGYIDFNTKKIFTQIEDHIIGAEIFDNYDFDDIEYNGDDSNILTRVINFYRHGDKVMSATVTNLGDIYINGYGAIPPFMLKKSIGGEREKFEQFIKKDRKKEFEEGIKKVRKLFYSLNYNTLIKETYQSNYGGLWVDVYKDNKTFKVKAIKQKENEGGKVIKEFYFDNDSLYFIYNITGTPNTETRSYISDNEVIGLMIGQKATSCSSECYFDENSLPYKLLREYYNLPGE